MAALHITIFKCFILKDQPPVACLVTLKMGDWLQSGGATGGSLRSSPAAGNAKGNAAAGDMPSSPAPFSQGLLQNALALGFTSQASSPTASSQMTFAGQPYLHPAVQQYANQTVSHPARPVLNVCPRVRLTSTRPTSDMNVNRICWVQHDMTWHDMHHHMLAQL